MSLTRHRTIQYIGILLALGFIAVGYWYFRSEAAQTVTTGSDTARPDFEAPLTTDLNLTRGSGKPTFTRSDGAHREATVTDFEGLIKPVRDGEARFVGARRVENLLGYTERLDYNEASIWYQLLGATATANTVAAPDGTMTAETVSFGTDVDSRLQSRVSYITAGETYVYSIWLRAPSATSVELYIMDEVSPYLKTTVTVSVSTVWQRFSVTRTVVDAAASDILICLSGTGSATTFYAWGAQVEEVTGQANQNPSEYVSNDVKTLAPYHGANVDNVKYFATENGNTVASNVVTEATGAAIPEATLQGYLAEGTRTNLVPYSEQMDQSVWYKWDSTITANAAVSPRGRTTAEKLVENSSTAAHYVVYDPITISSGTVYTVSVYLKQGERTHAQVRQQTTNGAVYANVDLAAGTITASGVLFGSVWTFTDATITSVGDDWYRVTVSGSSTETNDKPVVFLQDGVNTTYTGDGSSGIYLWGAQLEQAAFASSYIPTTTTSVSRGSDQLYYPGAGNFVDAEGTVSVDVTPEWSDMFNLDTYSPRFVTFTTEAYLSLWFWSNGGSKLFVVDRSTGSGGTRNNPSKASPGFSAGTLARLAMSWQDGSTDFVKSFMDGSLAASTASPTVPFDTLLAGNVYPGGKGGNNTAYASIKNFRSWKKAMSETFLNNSTAGQSGVIKQSVAETADDTGLVGYWSFEDGSGTKATDFSGNGNTGTLYSMESGDWVDSPRGKALSFDGGTDEYVNAGHGSSLEFTGDITISAWINPSFLADYDMFIGKYTSSTDTGYDIGVMSNGSLTPIFRDGSHVEQFSTVGLIQTGVWQHIVVTQQASDCSVRIYRNGVRDSVLTSQPCFDDASGYDLSIGSRNNSVNNHFPGSVDEVRLYNRILSQDEIMDLYQLGATKLNVSQNTKQTSGLIGLWSFNGPDISGTTAYDRSGQGNNGTLTSGPVVTEGKVGQALSFDGTDDYIALTDSTTLKPALWTVAAWIYADTGAVLYRGIFRPSYGSGYTSGFLLLIDNANRVAIRYGNGTAYVNSMNSGTSVLGAWHHVAATFDGTTMALYLDGVEKSSINASTFGYSVTNDSASIAEGPGTEKFDGLIDEVRLYNYAFSAPEIVALYNMGR